MVCECTIWPFITYVTFIMRLRRPEIISTLPPKKQINKSLQENNWAKIHDLLKEEIERREAHKTKLDAPFLGRLLLNICIKIYKTGGYKKLDDMPIHVKIIDMIMALQPVTNSLSKTGKTVLHFASTFHNAWLVTKLVEQGADIDAVDDNGNSPLCVAIDRNNIPVIDCLLGHNPQLSIGTMNVLDMAIERGNLLVIQTLLHYVQANVSGHEQANSIIQPCHILLAAEKTRFNVVEFFLNQTEVTVAPEEAEAILTALFEYIFESTGENASQMIQNARERYQLYASMVERLFSMNLDNNAISNLVMNVIMLDAATLMHKLLNQYPEQVKYCEDNFLEIFATYGSMETLQVLFDKGAKWKAGAAFNQLVANGHLSMVQKMLPMELACITAENPQDNGQFPFNYQFPLPLKLAYQKNHWDIVNYFLDLAKDTINYQPISRKKAGWILVSLVEFLANELSEIAGKMPLVDKILALKPETDLLLNYGTALHWAALSGSTALVEKLLVQQLDINKDNGRLLTPLHVAVSHGHEEIVQCLLKNGADFTLLTPKEHTLLQLARMKGHEPVVHCIEKFVRDWAMEAMLILMNICDKENYFPCYLVFNYLQSTGYLHAKLNVNLREIREYKASKKSDMNSITHFSMWIKPKQEEEKPVVDDTLNTTPP